MAGALLGALIPGLVSPTRADAAVVHAVREVAAGLTPMIVLNAIMSALIPPILMLRTEASRQPWSRSACLTQPRSVSLV
ncbi:MAG: hypothetical protein DI601_17385 [Azospirillum brasilense]|nr:MAG: hypothetical protein DI601_17385 [Azospirillum brasilense]